MFRISKIELEGIQTYYDKQIIDLTKQDNFIIVSGRTLDNQNQSNGTGKSSIFKQINYGLGLSQKIPKSIISLGKKEQMIKLTLIDYDNNQVLEIERHIYKSNKPSILQITLNGQDISTQRINFYNDILENQILGISGDIYRYLRFMIPEYTSILRSNPQEILKFLEKIFKVYLVDDYYAQTNQKIQQLMEEQNKLSILIQKESEEIEQIEKKKTKQYTSTDTIQEIDKLKREIQQLEQQISNIDWTQIQTKINSIKKDIQDIKNDIYQAEVEIKNQKKEKEKFIELKNNNQCPTCHTKIKGNAEIEQYFEKIIQNSNNIEILNKNQIVTLKSNLNNLSQELKDQEEYYKQLEKNKTVLSQKYKILERIESLNEKVNESITKQTMQSIQDEIQRRNKILEQNTEQLKSVNTTKHSYEYLQEIFSPKSKIRKELMLKFLNTGIKQPLQYFSSYFFKEQYLDFILDSQGLYFGLNSEKQFIEYGILSSGEKRKCDIIFQLQMNMLLDKMYDLNLGLMVMDESLDNLDSESQVIMMEVLNDYQKKHNLQIMITSHYNVIDFEDQVILDVIKNGNKSNIMVKTKVI